MLHKQHPLMIDDELVVDLFAGGGGASSGIEAAIGRPVDIAVNHNPEAISMHETNHPQTRHFCESVWDVCPRTVTAGRPVALLHASPDCTHFSQAKGGQPRDRAIRSLSWVVHRWAGAVRPKVITLENVEQILTWSPLIAKRCPSTGRVLKTCGTVAAVGERVPVDQQFLIPDKQRKGHNWRHFVDGLRRMGYVVQWRKIVAADRSDTWAVCSREHHDTVLANPQEWPALPGDVYEVRALYAEPVFPRPALSRESIADAVADLLGNGVYTCQRQWSAWSYGTMGPDDFVPTTMEIADAVAELLKAAPASCAAGPSKAIQHDRSVMGDIGAIPGGQS